jgi:hypothetical protein
MRLLAGILGTGWAKESEDLAESTAYNKIQPGRLPSQTYNRVALKVARQRVAWGGYRLAALLNAIWPEQNSGG